MRSMLDPARKRFRQKRCRLRKRGVPADVAILAVREANGSGGIGTCPPDAFQINAKSRDTRDTPFVS